MARLNLFRFVLWAASVLTANTFCSYSAFRRPSLSLTPTLAVRHNGLLRMGGAMLDLDDNNRREILSGVAKPVLVDAYAPWCGPCKLMEPILSAVAEKHSDLDVVKYNIESGNNSELKLEMMLQGVIITKLPSLVLYKDGAPIASRDGFTTEKELDEFLSSNLSVSSEEEASMPKKGFVSFAAFDRDDYAL